MIRIIHACALVCLLGAFAVAAACGGASKGADSAAGKNGDGTADGPPVPVDVDVSKLVALDRRDVIYSLRTTAMRDHAIGKRLGPYLATLPQLKQTFALFGKNPVTDLDWVYVTGPSLAETTEDAVLVQYATKDETVDATIDALAAGQAKSAVVETGVDGASGTKLTLDGGSRVVLRVQPHFAAVLPPGHAKATARTLATSKPILGTSETDAFRIRLLDPHRFINDVPSNVREARGWIVPRSDGGADATVEGDCDDEQAARVISETLKQLVNRYNTFLVRLMTRGAISDVKVSSEGNKVKVFLAATYDQLEAVLGFLGAQQGVSLDQPKASN